MKTNKFENTIRQKLESIEPDFQEADWTKMQNFMQAHTPPTFWQQYGSWLGYAAAASVSTVMAFMYVNQLSQTNNLVSDVKKLQSQIEVIKNTPTPVTKTDTVYILQQELAKDQFAQQEVRSDFKTEHNEVNQNKEKTKSESELFIENRADQTVNDRKESSLIADKSIDSPGLSVPETLREKGERSADIHVEKSAETFRSAQNSELNKPELFEENSINKEFKPNKHNKTYQEPVSNKEFASNYTQPKYNDSGATVRSGGSTPVTPTTGKALDENFSQLSEIQLAQTKSNSRNMNYALANRLSSREVRKVWMASVNPPVSSPSTKPVIENKKAEQVAKADNVIPKLNIKAPYRFGAAIQFEGKNQVKTVLGEVLVGKKFSISAGVSWLKIKPMEFFTEKIFRVKNGQDFKRSHPNDVPMALEILNIKVKPTLVQIPLTVAFRNDLNNNFSYFVSAGTNVTVKGREQFSFDCRLPFTYPNRNDVFTQGFERKMDIPAINSVNFSAGVEKRWHPVVVQVEGYVYNYFKPISADSPRTGPGVKLKLLYQIGGKM